MRTGLEKRQIDYVIDQCKKGRKTSHVAEEMGIGQRRVQQIWAEFRDAGRAHMAQSPGRMPVRPTVEQIEAVPDACKTRPAGVARTAKYLRSRNIVISYNIAYKIMKENKLVVHSATKSRRRIYVNSPCVEVRLSFHPVTIGTPTS